MCLKLVLPQFHQAVNSSRGLFLGKKKILQCHGWWRWLGILLLFPLFYMPFSGQPHIPNNNIQIADELLMYLSLGLPSWYSEASSQHRRDLIASTLRRKPPSLIGLKLLAPGPMSRILQTLSRWRDSGSKVSGLMICTVRFLLLTWLVLGGVGLPPLAAAAKLLLVPWLVMLIRKIN